MIPKQCKRLAEVDFPLAAVSKHAAQEKSIRHGHPSTLHLWWARRPLASSRAMLLALLLPDPCDSNCPDGFKQRARKLLSKAHGEVAAGDDGLRQELLKFIGDFADWRLSAHSAFIKTARGLVQAAHGEERPLVVDPFAGGGSIPLEALRLGCGAFASDLNPVACFILKVMLEHIPRYGVELVDELRAVGEKIKNIAERNLREFYPDDPDGARPIAYLWARTARCESPNCGAEIPLLRSFWLCKKKARKWALRYSTRRTAGKAPTIEFEVFAPKNNGDVPDKTVDRAKATCLCCNTVLSPERVRAQLTEQRGGADVLFDKRGKRIGGARMIAVVTVRPKTQGRQYRLPVNADYAAVHKAQIKIAEIVGRWDRAGKKGLCPIPDEPLPPIGSLGFRVQRYGMSIWADLFTARQKVDLITLGNAVKKTVSKKDDLLSAGMSFCIDKVAMQNNSGCRWKASGESLVDAFGRQAMPIVWDFAESNPIGGSTGDFFAQVGWIAKTFKQPLAPFGQVQPADAAKHPLPDHTANVWFTDPPYYDAIPYADLSDFFLVWLKRTTSDNAMLQDPFDPDNPLSPKQQEAVQDDIRKVGGVAKDDDFYEQKMAEAFSEGRRVLREDGVGSVVFAHKTTEGWEALLAGMLASGWTITGSWPIATEMSSRLRAHDSAVLATSVHLVCRPRQENAGIGDWANVLRELPERVASRMQMLEHEGVRGADLVFACIGPALEVFSRYQKVEKADGREITLADYLQKVWEVIGQTALRNILGAEGGMTGVLEEDARLSALFLWTLQSAFATANDNGQSGRDNEEAPRKAAGFSLAFDMVRRFAQPLGIDLEAWEGRIIETEKGVVRLLAVPERAGQLFGAAADNVHTWVREDPQQTLFSADSMPPVVRGRGEEKSGMINADDSSATTLDRVHAAMLLQLKDEPYALRTLIQSEQERGPDFLRLANAFSALYPGGSVEKRVLDAMLLTVRR